MEQEGQGMTASASPGVVEHPQEGEELESNILQVGQRGPANLSVRRRNRDWTPGNSIIVQQACREMNVAAPW